MSFRGGKEGQAAISISSRFGGRCTHRVAPRLKHSTERARAGGYWFCRDAPAASARQRTGFGRCCPQPERPKARRASVALVVVRSRAPRAGGHRHYRQFIQSSGDRTAARAAVNRQTVAPYAPVPTPHGDRTEKSPGSNRVRGGTEESLLDRGARGRLALAFVRRGSPCSISSPASS